MYAVWLTNGNEHYHLGSAVADEFVRYQIIQLSGLMLPLVSFHIIIYVLIVRHRRKAYTTALLLVQQNYMKCSLLWAAVISISTTFLFTACFLFFFIPFGSNDFSGTGPSYKARETFTLIGHYLLFIVLHIPTVTCCLKKKPNFFKLIPDSCCMKTSCCNYFFQSFALYVIFCTPHTIFYTFTLFLLAFFTSPFPSATLLIYFGLIFAGLVLSNAVFLYLLIPICRIPCICRRLVEVQQVCFGILIVAAAYVTAILVLQSLFTSFFATQEATNFVTLIPGAVVTVGGWYYSGKIAQGFEIIFDNASPIKEDQSNTQDATGTYYHFNDGSTGENDVL